MGSLDLLIIGIPIVFVASFFVIAMVRRELAPAVGMEGASRWILTAAIGMGIIAFSIKLTAFAVISSIPARAIAPALVVRPVNGSTIQRANDGFDALDSNTYVWQALPKVAPAPVDNPTTAEKVALGRRLFFDRNLSLTGEVSCASCHDVDRGGGVDGLPTSTGIRSQKGGRNAPTVWNAAFQSVLFWDGRAKSLEEQAKGPPLNPIEMGMSSPEAVVRRVEEDSSYRQLFDLAFNVGAEITFDRIAQAIAAYERTLITPDTPYDRFVLGDKHALSSAQLRGMALFQTTGCVRCHMGPNFSAASVTESGSPYRLFPANASAYETRYRLTQDTGALPPGSERGMWRVPSLRNVALTAPYFHNGAVSSLEEAVRVMATVQLGATLDQSPHGPRKIFWSAGDKTLAAIDRQALSKEDVADIAEFLRALTSDRLVAAAKRQPILK